MEQLIFTVTNTQQSEKEIIFNAYFTLTGVSIPGKIGNVAEVGGGMTVNGIL